LGWLKGQIATYPNKDGQGVGNVLVSQEGRKSRISSKLIVFAWFDDAIVSNVEGRYFNELMSREFALFNISSHAMGRYHSE
jgi:hypothetical protein